MFIHGLSADNIIKDKSTLSVTASDVIKESGNILKCLVE